MVLEAAGEDEAARGVPTVGKAGQYLWSNLKRAGIEREGWRVHNVLSCQPPGNKLRKMPYELSVIQSCTPLLDATISEMRTRGKLVILALGRIASARILGISVEHPFLNEEYYCYPIWSERYGAWVLSAPHPSYLMRGNSHELPILTFAAHRALEIAAHGFTPEQPTYILDPEPAIFQRWVHDYQQAVARDPEGVFLSFDIETPYKKGKSEDTLDSTKDEDDVILRVSFAYEHDSAVSIPWTAHYLPAIRELFATDSTKFGWNSDEFDVPRIIKHLPINGTLVDAMVAWHILHSALPKGLGFVTPFYTQFLMWKHLSNAQPALYSAIDALAALRCWKGICRDLKSNGQWAIYERHVLQLNKALQYMSNRGLMRDEGRRAEAEAKLVVLAAEVDLAMSEAVPNEAKDVKVYKKTPKETGSLVRVRERDLVKRCSHCGLPHPTKPHFKATKKVLNPCAAASVVVAEEDVERWARQLPFKVSKTSLLRYQKVKRHAPVKDKEGKVTFDVNALKRLQKTYPADPLYKLIGRQRHLTKMASTYIGRTQEDGTIRGGMPVGPDGLGHPIFTHNPETLRLSCSYFHQLPRPKGPNDPATWVRNTIVARPGHVFHARDFSGIEAVLVGYEAQYLDYIRLAKMDVHSFFTAYSLHEYDKAGFPANDLPSLAWDDAKLSSRLADIKATFKQERNNLYKHLTHAINFGQGAKGAQEKIYKETDILQPLDKITRVMGVYKELFPKIPAWHNEVRLQADRDGYLKNAFNYVLRFNRVFAWSMESGEWKRKLGDDAEAVLAFRPQSNAAGIIKETILRLFQDHFEEAGQYLRLQVHDENFLEVPEEMVESVDMILKVEMERPIPQLPLPSEWGMGPHLSILTEAKTGHYWGEMH